MNKTKKDYRKTQIAHIVWKNNSISRSQISNLLKLNLPKTLNLIQEMINDGTLIEDGQAQSTGGRKAQLISLNPAYGYVMGIDFSTKGISACIANFKGMVVFEQSDSFSYKDGKNIIIEKIYNLIDAVNSFAKDNNFNLLHVGICISGLVDKNKGISISFPRLDDWSDVPLKKFVENECGINTSIINHIYAINLAENIYGEHKNYKNLFYFHIGPGLGAGIKINGEIYKSQEVTEGEFGHTTAIENGPICYCGNYGCLESIASDTALVKQVMQAERLKVDSSLFHGRKSSEEITAQEIFRAAETDRLAANICEEAGKYIGTGMANLINIFSPQAIIIGGSMAVPDSVFIKSTINTLNKRVLIRLTKNLKIHFSSFGNKSGIKGAIAFALERYFNSQF